MIFWRSVLFVVCFHFIQLDTVRAYGGGAPCTVLSSLQPGPPHGPPQSSPSPYGLRVTDRNGKLVTSGYKATEVYTVEIYARCGTWIPIRGFLVTAKDDAGEIAGTFLKDDSNYWQAVQYPCRDSKFGSVTHYSAYDRPQAVVFHWQLGDHPANNIHFSATVVQSFHMYWKDLSWPEAPTANCLCQDKKDFDCAGYSKSNQCDTPSVRDGCMFTCNNCSTAVKQ